VSSLKNAKVQRTWHKLCDHYDDLARTALELLVHPDATPEQIEQTRKVLRELRASILETRAVVDKHYRLGPAPLPNALLRRKKETT
jgi:hypothetical protein